MLKFLCFGSGSSGNCYYLSDGNEAIIIDAGIGIRTIKKYFLEYGVDVKNIKAILVTHDHFDHVKAAGELSKFLNVKVYASELVLKKMTSSYRSKLQMDCCVPVYENISFQLGHFNVCPFRLPHDSVDNFGYLIDTGLQNFILMTDIGMPTEAVCRYISKAENLVIESDFDEDMLDKNPRYYQDLKERIKGPFGHLSNRQTAELIANNYHPNLKNVWLCHLSAENNLPDKARDEVAAKLLENGIVPGEDVIIHVLMRKKVSGPWILK